MNSCAPSPKGKTEPAAAMPVASGAGIEVNNDFDCADLAMIGPYELIKVLGKGSYATVKLGIHHRTGEKVAVKIINKAIAKRSPNLLRRVEREVAVMRMMNHPNVTKLIDFMETHQMCIIVMEYIPGSDLFHYLKKMCIDGGLPLDHAFRLFYQMVSALEYCHSCGIAHRDIKPENILMDESFQVAKFTDFGMANLIRDRQLMETSCGSPHYAAPEVIRGEKYCGQTADVWSLGIVLFGMCARRLPFNSRNVTKLLKMICHGFYVMPPRFEAPLRELITQMLHPIAKKRIPLSAVKKHPWWLSNCASQHLNPNGIYGQGLLVPRPIPTSAPVPVPKPPTVHQQPSPLGSPRDVTSGVTGNPMTAQPMKKSMANAAYQEDPPVTEHPLLKMDISALSESDLVAVFTRLQTLAAALLDENIVLKGLCEQETAAARHQTEASVWNPEEAQAPISEPFDTEVINFIVDHQGWKNCDDLKKELLTDDANITKAYYRLLMQQKSAYGSLAHLKASIAGSPIPDELATNEEAPSPSPGEKDDVSDGGVARSARGPGGVFRQSSNSSAEEFSGCSDVESNPHHNGRPHSAVPVSPKCPGTIHDPQQLTICTSPGIDGPDEGKRTDSPTKHKMKAVFASLRRIIRGNRASPSSGPQAGCPVPGSPGLMKPQIRSPPGSGSNLMTIVGSVSPPPRSPLRF